MGHPVPVVGWIIPPFLRGLGALVLARLTVEGRLLDANLGFWRMVGRDPLPPGCLIDVTARFVTPSFGELSRAARVSAGDGPLYEGLLTLGNPGVFGQTLLGAVYRDGDAIVVAAEHDVSDLERLSAEVMQLNGDLADAQREMTRHNRFLQRSNREILDSSRTDALTGAANRRRFDERLAEELERSQRNGEPLSLALADVDHFKSVNDGFGHLAGDAVLVALVRRMRSATRPYDVVARWGGEEFAILLPATLPALAVEVAERIRVAFSAERIAEVGRQVTVSFGITSSRSGDTAASFVARADAALYRAKETGRDRACFEA